MKILYLGIILIIMGMIMPFVGMGEYVPTICRSPPHTADEVSFYVDCGKQREPVDDILIYGGIVISFSGIGLLVYSLRHRQSSVKQAFD